jgi:hypothetical protein
MSAQSNTLSITPDILKQVTETDAHGDTDLNRDENQQRSDKRLGDTGELAFKKLIENNYGLLVVEPDTYKYDWIVGGTSENTGVTVDVKARKGWEPYDDLLVRNKMGSFPSDLYVQVIVDGSRDNFTQARLTGFATREMVQNGERFSPPNSKHPKKLVKHNNLIPMSKFSDYIEKIR